MTIFVLLTLLFLFEILGHFQMMFQGGNCLGSPGFQIRVITFRAVALEKIDSVFMRVFLFILVGFVEVVSGEASEFFRVWRALNRLSLPVALPE